MIVPWLLAAATAAEPCVDLAVRLEAAWAAFNDAEPAEAERLLDLAIDELACQRRPLEADELFSLFSLDATASLATEELDGAASAAIRGVTMAPSRAVDPRFGPEVAELFDSWRHRLRRSFSTLQVVGPAPLRLDGYPIEPGAQVELLEGEHVLQWTTLAGLHTEVREITGDVDVATDRVEGAVTAVTRAAAPDEPSGEPTEPTPATPTTPPPPARKPVGTPALWGTGLAVAALGGGAVVAGWQIGERFVDNPYEGTYQGLSQGQTGWRDARAEAIEHDATMIRALLGTGYGLLGAGGLLFGVGLAVHATPQGGGVAVTLPLR